MNDDEFCKIIFPLEFQLEEPLQATSWKDKTSEGVQDTLVLKVFSVFRWEFLDHEEKSIILPV